MTGGSTARYKMYDLLLLENSTYAMKINKYHWVFNGSSLDLQPHYIYPTPRHAKPREETGPVLGPVYWPNVAALPKYRDLLTSSSILHLHHPKSTLAFLRPSFEIADISTPYESTHDLMPGRLMRRFSTLSSLIRLRNHALALTTPAQLAVLRVFPSQCVIQPQNSRSLALVRDDKTLSELWFSSTSPRSEPKSALEEIGNISGGDPQPPDERTLKLGKS